MSDKKEKPITTEPGAMDDPGVERQRRNTRSKKKMLQDIFDDNKTGRPQHPDSGS